MAPPRYRARSWGQLPSKVGPRRIEQDQEFDWSGPPGRWMIPVNDAAREAWKQRFPDIPTEEEPPLDVYAQKRNAVIALAEEAADAEANASFAVRPGPEPASAAGAHLVDPNGEHQAPRRRRAPGGEG